MVSIKYKQVSIAYDDFIVVENLSLDINDGEITTLLGPSGCGKTTLLRAIAGFVEPYEGQVYIGDKEVTILPPQKRNTAMIFQNYALWPHMTIFKNVEYGLKLRLKEKVVFYINVDDSGVITKLNFTPYAATKEIEEIAQKLVDYALGKTTEEVWNSSSEILKEIFESEEKIPFRIIKYVFGLMKKDIRSFYELVKTERPKWLPSRKTKFERSILIKPLYLYFFWLTKPYYWVNRKKNYLDAKAEVDYDFRFRKEKVQEVLALVHLEDQIDKNPTELSGGQQQRIALARSIVVEPDVLLCDEPLSNLDAKLRKELRTEIRSIIKTIGMTAIYVTHDQAEALAISDRIAVMNIGDIEQYGTPTEVFTDPKTLFVGQFIGSSSTLSGKAIKSDIVELAGGEQIKVTTKESLKIGSDVDLVIRPEVVSLTQVTDNPIEIEINTIEYLGNEVKLTGLLKDETMLLVDVVEQTEEYAKMKVGDVLKAHIISEQIFVFVDGKRVY